MLEKMVQYELYGCHTIIQSHDARDAIDRGEWIKPTNTSSNPKELIKKATTLKLGEEEEEIRFNLPDISGGDLENLANKIDQFKEKPPSVLNQLFTTSKDPDEQLLLSICQASGIIIMVDLADLPVAAPYNSTRKYALGQSQQMTDTMFIRRLADIMSENYGLDIGSPVDIPVLIVLNKADLYLKKDELSKLYTEGQNPKSFFCTEYATANNCLKTCFDPKKISYTWHSTVGKTYDENNTNYPDYKHFQKIDGRLYTKSFIKFIERTKK
jgi:hypothetical protein